MTSIRILIVEDEIIVAKDIKNSLEELGYTVTAIADSGIEAIAQAAANKPELVLMDINLKHEMTGIQAAAEIRTRFHIPVVFITARSDTSTLKQVRAAEPFGYITKPFREQDLQTTIEMAVYRHQLEKQLKDREQWLTTILSSISDAVMTTDEKKCITLLNPAAELLTGWKQDEALGKNLTEVLNLIGTETHKLLESFSTQYLSEQTILITKIGTEIPIDCHAAPIEDEQGTTKGVVVCFRDITARIETEQNRLVQARAEQLEVQMAELERLNRLKDDFLSTVSHELRTPMANIRMAVKMLEISLSRSREYATSVPSKAGDRSIDRYLQILKDECGREIELIENILDLQRLEAGVQTFTPEVIHCQTWLPQLVEPFLERANNHQQTLQLDLPADLPSIFSDTASVGRIVAELLNNACKYTPMGEKIALTVKAIAGKIQLQVCNTGVEIPAQELSHVFEKFYRVPSLDPWKQGGTGLGLALVQKLVEQLGGAIATESGGNKTCFIVELPVDLT